MNERARRAVLECCRLATTVSTQSGRHVNPISELIVDGMVDAGYPRSQVFSKGREIILPGWFRPSKKWDITAYDGGALLGAIELKSINSHFSNNSNNRAEESLGSATDVEFAVKGHLMEPTALRPNFGYVLIVNENKESLKKVSSKQRSNTPIYGTDPLFEGASYVDRFVVMGQRLLSERIYQAVWVATVDLEAGTAREPSPYLTYEKFMAGVKSWLDIARA